MYLATVKYVVQLELKDDFNLKCLRLLDIEMWTVCISFTYLANHHVIVTLL